MTCIFIIEVILKIIANGVLFCGSQSYLLHQLNQVDLFVVIVTLLSYLLSTLNLNAIKVLRIIKIFRPLRAISKNEGLRQSIKSLVVALPEIMQVIFIMILFFYIFSIISVNYFKGLLYNCTTEGLDPYFKYLDPLLSKVDTKWDCLNSGADWKNRYLNFDNVLESMASLYVLSCSI